MKEHIMTRQHRTAWIWICLPVLAYNAGQSARCGDTASPASKNVIDVEKQRELFVDGHLIERMTGVRQKLHRPRDRGIVLKFDNSWEGRFCGYATVIKDGSRYRVYYRGLPSSGRDGSNREVTCIAESSDGIHWTKPKLRLFTVDGVRENNIILADHAPLSHNFCPMIDTRRGVSPSQRYKAVGGTGRSGLVAFVSPDGIHWKKLRNEPVFKDGAFDSQNVPFWSESEQKYLLYFRVFANGFRRISRTTSTDFIHWSKPVLMEYGGKPIEHLYTNQTHPYFRAPQIYVSIAARFFPGRRVLTAGQARAIHVDPKYFNDCSDGIFMTTRGGNQYDRRFMEGFLRPGIGLENWVSRTNYPALNVVPTGPTEMSFYANQNYGQPTAHLRRYSLRTDGFVSINAPYAGGELLTRPLRFRGNQLRLNFSTSAAGGVRIEIQNAHGKPLPGFALSDSVELIGNEIERAGHWKSGSDVSRLAGQTIRLRFVMKDADLYALRFGP